MHISRLILPASDVANSAAFFRDVLELPTAGNSIQVGWSEIQLIAAAEGAPHGVHLAFNVPFARFDMAVAWLEGRTLLQKEPGGEACFALEGDWQSRSIYFDGPDNAVLELIGRRRLIHPADKRPFSGADLSCLSEVGVPSDDVEGMVAEAAWTFGVGTVGPASSSFAAIGNDEGMLIAVDPNRPWFPQKRQRPGANGLEIWVNDVKSPGTVSDAQHGWKVRAR
ncbi:VOC family protein [Ensifer sp. ENS03]|uniref:VOC family protein n=1 Tax=Ensifer TaxID=106591 RepID=UPI00177B6282|nr:VOC family protein [Ensifer sp. ENS03]MBD9555213.1 VOC family protein [Ensifer sp. ENS03]